jgi:hypothetical protein
MGVLSSNAITVRLQDNRLLLQNRYRPAKPQAMYGIDYILKLYKKETDPGMMLLHWKDFIYALRQRRETEIARIVEHWPEEKSLEDNNISFYEGFDQFCEKEDIREADEDIFYGAAFEEFNREWQGEDDSIEEVLSFEEEAKDESPDYKKMPLAERVAILPKPTEDVMEELRMYEKRMGYDKDTMRSMRYKMNVYDEFLEEYEARKKQWGTEKIENYKKIKERGER